MGSIGFRLENKTYRLPARHEMQADLKAGRRDSALCVRRRPLQRGFHPWQWTQLLQLFNKDNLCLRSAFLPCIHRNVHSLWPATMTVYQNFATMTVYQDFATMTCGDECLSRAKFDLGD